jgi:hypothetical protein
MTNRIVFAAGLSLLTLLMGAQSASTPASDAPTYASDGGLNAPMDYREWVFLTSGIDMSYAAQTAAPGAHSMFDNVFVNPSSYRIFMASGTWPDKTTMVLEIRGADDPVSINKRGHTQSAQIMGMELHVKDHGTWNFYDLSGSGTVANLIPRPANCYTCHEAHAAVDTTFAQFYPTLLPVATAKKTLSPAYLAEMPSKTTVAPGAAK